MPIPKNTVRSLAVSLLQEVLDEGHFASERLDFYLRKFPQEGHDRGLLTQLLYGILREKGFLDHVLGKYLDFSKTPSFLQQILRLGAYQILLLERIPDHASIFESVELAKQRGKETSGRFVNAILRQIQRDREIILREKEKAKGQFYLESVLEVDALRKWSWSQSFPRWILRRWLKRYERADIRKMVEVFNQVPPVYLRINTCKFSTEEILKLLPTEGVEIPGAGYPMVKLDSGSGDKVKELLSKGMVSIQDIASFKIVKKLEIKPSELGLDACAGHGGKASALAEISGSPKNIWVHDVSAERLSELRENFSRLGFTSPEVLESPEEGKKQGLSFDWILVDAPCSGMGTMGRKPEIRWRLKAEDLKRFCIKQKEILRTWIPFLKSGGRLLYAVCSLEPEEGEEVIESILKEFSSLEGVWREEMLPNEGPQDGFFCALLNKA